MAPHFEGVSALINLQIFPPLLLFVRGFEIQQRQITLPAYGHHTCEEGSILRQDVCKVESSDSGPKLATVDETSRHGALDPLPCIGEAIAGQEGLHTEEVAVENGCEYDLIDNDFDSEGEEFRGIIENGA